MRLHKCHWRGTLHSSASQGKWVAKPTQWAAPAPTSWKFCQTMTSALPETSCPFKYQKSSRSEGHSCFYSWNWLSRNAHQTRDALSHNPELKAKAAKTRKSILYRQLPYSWAVWQTVSSRGLYLGSRKGSNYAADLGWTSTTLYSFVESLE